MIKIILFKGYIRFDKCVRYVLKILYFTKADFKIIVESNNFTIFFCYTDKVELLVWMYIEWIKLRRKYRKLKYFANISSITFFLLRNNKILEQIILKFSATMLYYNYRNLPLANTKKLCTLYTKFFLNKRSFGIAFGCNSTLNGH